MGRTLPHSPAGPSRSHVSTPRSQHGTNVMTRRLRCRAPHGHVLDPRHFVKDNLIGTDGLITSFAQHRQMLLKHTSELLCGDDSIVRQPDSDREAKLSALLVSSLEELKVAEEELVERTEALADLRNELQ